MNTDTKIIIAVFLLALLGLFLWREKKASDKKKAEEKPPCKELTHGEWTVRKNDAKLIIQQAEMAKWAPPSLDNTFYEKYRIEAVSKGIPDTAWDVIEYAAPIEAEKKLIADGYCKP